MTKHKLYIDDAKHALTLIPASSIDLIITGPPYWNEVIYSNQPGQLSAIADYQIFLQKITETQDDQMYDQMLEIMGRGKKDSTQISDWKAMVKKYFKTNT